MISTHFGCGEASASRPLSRSILAFHPFHFILFMPRQTLLFTKTSALALERLGYAGAQPSAMN